MKRWLVLVLGSIVAVGLIVPPAASSSGKKVLEFRTMVAVDGPFVGSPNPIRGINGGGLPWQIEDAAGKLSSSGSLDVRVRGLVLLDGPPVPEALQGTNPAANFRAIVSCTTIVDGAPATTNVATDPFPATVTGDSKIKAQVSLPAPCLAPIIFVGPSPTTWFAVTGQA